MIENVQKIAMRSAFDILAKKFFSGMDGDTAGRECARLCRAVTGQGFNMSGQMEGRATRRAHEVAFNESVRKLLSAAARQESVDG